MTQQHDFHGDEIDPRLARRIADAAPDRFGAGFTSRVMQRVERERSVSLSAALEKQFLRVIPILAAASLILAAYNWWGARNSSASAIDAMLRLPQATVASAYSTDALFGSAGQPMEQP